MTEFLKFLAMQKSDVVLADNGFGVKVEYARKLPGLERYLLCDCKATVYEGHYVVEGSAEHLYQALTTIVTEYAPAFLVC